MFRKLSVNISDRILYSPDLNFAIYCNAPDIWNLVIWQVYKDDLLVQFDCDLFTTLFKKRLLFFSSISIFEVTTLGYMQSK